MNDCANLIERYARSGTEIARTIYFFVIYCIHHAFRVRCLHCLLCDTKGRPLYAGLRYVSRLKREWECWAIFADRVRCRPLRVDPIAADDLHLHEAARILNLAIENGRGGLIVPA